METVVRVSAEYLFYEFAVDIGQTERSALIVESESLVVES